MSEVYINRLMEKVLETKLNSSGCVLVTGPKFCGKSTMCNKYAKSITALKTENDVKLASMDPKSALKGETPHLIDEWQKVPDIWNQIKNDLDNEYVFGKYIITGSTTPVDSSKILHSGAGRISSLVLKPFTLYESGESNGLVSLSELFNNNSDFITIYEKDNKYSLQDIAYLICRGGWPVSLKASKEYGINVTKNYYEGLFQVEDENDDFTLLLKNKNIDLLKTILKSFARNVSTSCKKSIMIKEIIESGIRSKLDEETFNSYEKVLKDLFIIYDMPSWNLNLRSSIVVRSSPTHHFVDTSIATACLGINPNDLLNDLNSFGLFFEDFCVRDLSVYANKIDGTIKHYRDSSDLEVDAIIELSNGKYGAIEIKLASEENIKKGIKSLINFENKLKNNNLKLPKFKMILTSHGGCYKSKEGIYIVPITFLKD